MSFYRLSRQEEEETIRRFSEVMLPLIILTGIFLLYFELRRLKGEYLSFPFIFHSFVLFGLFVCFVVRKRLTPLLSVLFLLTLLYAETLYSLFAYGLESRSLLGLSYLCIFLYLFFGKKVGYISLSVVSILILFKGVLIRQGYLQLEPSFCKSLTKVEFWALLALAFGLYPLPLLFLVGEVKDKLRSKLEELTRLNETLNAEIERREMSEKKVAELEDMYRSIAQSPVAGFFFLERTKLISANKRACEILGITEVQATERDFLEFVHPNQRPEIEKVLLSGSGVWESTMTCVRDDKKTLSLVISIVPIGSPDKGLYSGVMIDVTSEKKLEQELIHAQKMEAIGTLTQGIAHDFNNVLTAVTGYASLLRDRLEGKDPSRAYVERILSSCEKARSLIKDLLIFGRKDPVSMTELDLNDVVREAEGLMRRLLPEDVTFNLVLSKTKLPVVCDPTKIEQVLMNLASNAKDAMTDTKIVTIKTEPFEISDEFISAWGFGKKGNYALLSFSDTGCGMTEEVKKRIFEPFFTTKERGKGTGLGLSVAYSIIKQHQGYITVESTPGRGSTFYIYLPISGK